MLKKTLILILISNINSQPSPHGFRVQYIGHTRYVSPIEEKNREFCENFWCTNDAHLIFTKSSQYENQDPCEDFKNFTVGKAWEIDTVHERNQFRGFAQIVQDKFFERQRKTAAEKILKTDNRVIKIIKNTFQKCLKSRHTFRHLSAHEDIINHLKSLGGSPFLNQHIAFNPMKFNSSVDYRFLMQPGNFERKNENFELNLTKIFEIEPFHGLSLFFGLKISRCELKICIKIDKDSWSWREEGNYTHQNYLKLFEDLEDHYVVAPQFRKQLREKMFNPALEKFKKFVEKRNEILKKYKNGKFEVMKGEELNGKINWMEIVNSQLMTRYKIGKNSLISLEGGKKMVDELVELLEDFDDGTLADIFTITFLYHHRHALILRFYNNESEFMEGRRQSIQRWQRCLGYFHNFMRPAFYAMYEKKRPSFDHESGDFNRGVYNIIKSAEKFLEEAMDEAKKRFLQYSELPLSIAVDVLLKIKNLRILVGVTNKTLSIDGFESFYDELALSGEESFFKSVLEMEKFHRKLRNERSKRQEIDEMVQAPWIRYNIDKGNVLYVSPLFITYPAYHPLRPHFFNVATLFYYSIFYLDVGIRHYIEDHYNLTNYVTGLEFIDQIGYEFYKNWLKTHKELQIAANYLTNPQLYWVARAFVNFVKFQGIFKKFHSPMEQLQMQYLHIYYKRFPGFQEAFQCELNSNDVRQIFESVKKLDEIAKDVNAEFLLSEDQKVQANKAKTLLRILGKFL